MLRYNIRTCDASIELPRKLVLVNKIFRKKFWDQKFLKNPTKIQKSQETKVQKA
jgi:hypothetical protein